MKRKNEFIAMVVIAIVGVFLHVNTVEAKIPPKPDGEWFSWGDPVLITTYSTTFLDEYPFIQESITQEWDCQGWTGSC